MLEPAAHKASIIGIVVQCLGQAGVPGPPVASENSGRTRPGGPCVITPGLEPDLESGGNIGPSLMTAPC
jgi:hypothetical protein